MKHVFSGIASAAICIYMVFSVAGVLEFWSSEAECSQASIAAINTAWTANGSAAVRQAEAGCARFARNGAAARAIANAMH